MGFFAEFNTWLNGILAGYIGDNTATIAGALEPAIVTLAVVYVMIWGYLQLTGQIEEPFLGGVKTHHDARGDPGCRARTCGSTTVYRRHLLQRAGASSRPVSWVPYNPVTIIDQIIFNGGDAANRSSFRRAVFFHGNFSYYMAGYAVYVIVGLTAIYTIFLLTLSRIALSVLLALGPLFIALLFFESTKRFFEAWIAQLANYALITILTVLDRRAHADADDRRRAAGGEQRRGHHDRPGRARVHGRGADISCHAAGDAHGRGARERPGAELASVS